MEAAMEIGAFEAKNTLGSLLDRVERGEEIVITRRGRPVARLVPEIDGDERRRRAREAAKKIKELARIIGLREFNWEEWKAYRDEGRP
jgi:prevent-host-death family protein